MEDVAQQNGISKATYMDRINKLGWSPEKAATKSVKKRRKDRQWIRIAESNGIHRNTYSNRVDERFWSPKDAATIKPMDANERSKVANNAKVEYLEIINNEIFYDEDNLFKLTPQHYEVAKNNGISRENVKSRVYGLGWTVDEAITKPVRKRNVAKLKGIKKYKEIAKKNGISYVTLSNRLDRGWTLKDAATKPLVKPWELTRSDKEWIVKALENGISKNTYLARVDVLGWTVEEASNTQPLAGGEYLNDETKKRALEGFEKFNG